MFIDTHTHLYDDIFDNNNWHILDAIEAGITKMYMPNCASETIAPMLSIADEFKDHCFPMMGVHPTYIKDNYNQELNNVSDWLEKRKFYAIGEIGLDYYWDITHKTEQIIAFETQIDLALKYQLPVVIHSRQSMNDCIRIIKNKQKGNLKGIFHCFSGSIEEAKQIIDLGFYLGIGGVVTYKKSNLPDILKQISLSNVVLETDAPYLAPVPYRGKRNESKYIKDIALFIAEITKQNIDEVALITTSNAEKVFGV